MSAQLGADAPRGRAGRPLGLAGAAAPTARPLVRVRPWDLVVRVTHWVIAAAIVVLAATGFTIGHPFIVSAGPARDHFVMGTIKVVHSYTAIAFTLAVLSRILWMFIGKGHASWREFFPIDRDRRKGLWPTLAFYLFIRPRAPAVVGHNPLAGATYILVFALYLVMIMTGFGLYSVSANVISPMHAFRFLLAPFGGPQGARWVHHVVMWLLLGFVVHHVYSAILMAVVERNGTIDSIVTGNKWVDEDLAERDRQGSER